MGRVLIIDDNERMRNTLRDRLKEEGHHAVAWPGSTGVDAVIEQEHPDLVITDHNLNPGEEKGLDLAARLLAKGQKAVLMSTDTSLEMRALSRGVLFFDKSNSIEQLSAAIEMAGRA